MNDANGTLIAGKYRIVRPLAQGGMGAIFVGEHVELGTRVAIKRLSGDRGRSDLVARFRREAIAAATLKSQHIVHVFDFGEDEVGPYIIMELLEGEDLAGLLEREGRLSPEAALRIFEQVAAALSFAHKAGIIHRDIKPRNIFLARDPTASEPVVKVLDFGIAKQVTPLLDATSLTASHAILGSPGYMSPEQVRGQPMDQTTDVWALAVVLYELLVGRSPFLTEHVGDTLARICSGVFAPLAVSRPDLGPAWEQVFRSGLSVSVDERYQTIEEFQAGVRAACGEAFPSGDRAAGGTDAFRIQSDRRQSVTATLDRESWASSNGSTHDAITNTRSELAEKPPLSRGVLAVTLVGVLAVGTWLFTQQRKPALPSEPAPSPSRPLSVATGGQAAPLEPPAPPGPASSEPAKAAPERPAAERSRAAPPKPRGISSRPPPPELGTAVTEPERRRDPFTGIVETP